MASVLKSMCGDAILLSSRKNEKEQGRDLAKHIENLLSIITCNPRQNCRHKQEPDDEVSRIQNDITELWSEDVATAYYTR